MGRKPGQPTKRITITIPKPYADDLEAWAVVNGDDTASFAGIIVRNAIDLARAEGKIPDRIVGCTDLRQLALKYWDVLSETKIAPDRLIAIRDGATATTEEILRIAIALRVSEEAIEALNPVHQGKPNGAIH